MSFVNLYKIITRLVNQRIKMLEKKTKNVSFKCSKNKKNLISIEPNVIRMEADYFQILISFDSNFG